MNKVKLGNNETTTDVDENYFQINNKIFLSNFQITKHNKIVKKSPRKSYKLKNSG